MVSPCRGRTVGFGAEGLSAVAVAVPFGFPFLFSFWSWAQFERMRHRAPRKPGKSRQIVAKGTTDQARPTDGLAFLIPVASTKDSSAVIARACGRSSKHRSVSKNSDRNDYWMSCIRGT